MDVTTVVPRRHARKAEVNDIQIPPLAVTSPEMKPPEHPLGEANRLFVLPVALCELRWDPQWVETCIVKDL
jgi:hypothetical protein